MRCMVESRGSPASNQPTPVPNLNHGRGSVAHPEAAAVRMRKGGVGLDPKTGKERERKKTTTTTGKGQRSQITHQPNHHRHPAQPVTLNGATSRSAVRKIESKNDRRTKGWNERALLLAPVSLFLMRSRKLMNLKESKK